MTSKNGYVFFLPVYVSMKMNDTGFENEFCTVSSIISLKILLIQLDFLFSQVSEMKGALNGHFAFSHSSFG